MRGFLLIIIVLFSNSIFSQLIDSKETTFNNDNYFNQVVKSKKDDQLINGEVKFSNGIMKCENGKIVLVTYFYPNGNMRERSGYKNGEQDGLQEFYYKNGNLRESFNIDSENPVFVNNKDTWNHKQHMVGAHKRFYKNGQMMIEENSNKTGNLEGIQKAFFKTGQIKRQAKFRDGNLIEIECWNRKGQIIECK